MQNAKEDNNYKSNSELYIAWWLDDLLKEGYISKYEYEPEIIQAGEDITTSYNIIVKGKKKTRTVKRKMSVKYTPDFKVIWTDKALGVFIFKENTECISPKPLFYTDNYVTYLEVKPDHDYKNMTRNASSKIKLITYCTNKQIIIVKPGKLFKESFTPSRYKFTDKNKTERKIKHDVISLNQYVKSLQDDSNH